MNEITRKAERSRICALIYLFRSSLESFFCKNCRQTSSKFLEVYTIAIILPVLHFFRDFGAILFGGLVPQLPCSLNQFPEKMSSLGIVHWFCCVPRTNSEVNKYSIGLQVNSLIQAFHHMSDMSLSQTCWTPGLWRQRWLMKRN